MTEATGADRPTYRYVDLTKIGDARYKATNRRGGVLSIGEGDDPDFTPVELLLAAIAGCTAIDVEYITRKRAVADSFSVRAEGDKIRDENGNHLTNLRLVLDVSFPDGEAGDAARANLPDAIAKSRDRLCTVSRTVALGSPVEMVQASGGPAAPA